MSMLKDYIYNIGDTLNLLADKNYNILVGHEYRGDFSLIENALSKNNWGIKTDHD